MANIINILANFLINENEETMEKHLEEIVNLICKLESDHSDNS